MSASGDDGEIYYTLLGIRLDGVPSVVDVVYAPLPSALSRARALFKEHASCISIEIWRDSGLVERLARP